ncbi:hypothetical protein NJI34_10700 [Pseudomonas sp. S 311-6]|nr:hypothetical protein [Pseudomonas sp. S 311-6]
MPAPGEDRRYQDPDRRWRGRDRRWRGRQRRGGWPWQHRGCGDRCRCRWPGRFCRRGRPDPHPGCRDHCARGRRQHARLCAGSAAERDLPRRRAGTHPDR